MYIDDDDDPVSRYITGSEITTLNDAIIQFDKLKEEVFKALCDSNINVSSFIEDLSALSAVKSDSIKSDSIPVPLFDDHLFNWVTTIEELWNKLKMFWLSFFDCNVLEIFLQKSKCERVIKVFNNFSSKINQSSVLDNKDLVDFYNENQSLVFVPSLFRIKVNTEKCTNCTIENIQQILSKTFNLQKGALYVIDVKKGSVEIIFGMSEKLIPYFLNYIITDDILLKLHEYCILTLQVKDKEINIPDKELIKKVLYVACKDINFK